MNRIPYKGYTILKEFTYKDGWFGYVYYVEELKCVFNSFEEAKKEIDGIVDGEEI